MDKILRIKLTQSKRYCLFMLGLVLLLAVLFFNVIDRYIYGSYTSIASVRTSIYIPGPPMVPGVYLYGPILKDYHYEITYNGRMRIDETQTIIATLAKSYNIRNPLIPLLGLDQAMELDLVSSAFKIAPNQKQNIPIGTKIPHSIKWTITPKHLGDHALLLMLPMPGITEEQARKYQSTKLSINGKEEKIKSEHSIELKIIVSNIFGISQRTYEIIRGLIAVIGFMLIYPVVSEFVKRRFTGSSS